MSENDTEKKEQVFCIFNNDKENINMQIEKSFIAYLKNLIKEIKSIEDLGETLYNLSSRWLLE